MPVLEEVLRYIGSLDSVEKAIVMDDTLSNRILAIERTIRTRTNQGYRNLGYEEAVKRKHRICVFHTEGFALSKTVRVKLVTASGTMLGMLLTPEEIPEYQAMSNTVWLSNDFVLFNDAVGEGEEVFVLSPYDVHELESAVKGCRDAVGASPTMSSDLILKSVIGVPPNRPVYTTIIGFND